MLAPIRCLSAYSLLNSINRIDALVTYAKKQGYEGIGLADINYLHGIIEFDKSCRKHQIKPLFGLTIEYKIAELKYQLILVAMNNEGYQELIKVSSQIGNSKEVDFEQLVINYQNLYIIEPTETGRLWQYVMAEQYQEAKKWLANWKEQKFYVEISPYLSEQQLNRWRMFIDTNELAPVASQLVKYEKKEDAFSNHVLEAIGTGEVVNKNYEDKYYLPKASSFYNFYTSNNLITALTNLEEIYANCHVEIEYQKHLLPKFPVPNGSMAIDYLREQCQIGQQRIVNWNHEYDERLQKELQVIEEMGFADYFLIVWDVLNFARQENILTAPGRGSAAGSLVAYLLYITDVDPLEYGLLFERFLNPARQTMPDIDLDFPDLKRDKLFLYVQQKYGRDNVARIITYGTLAAKQVIRDVTKVYGLTKYEQDEWAQAVFVKAHDTKATLEVAYQDSYKLRQLINRSERNQNIFKIALKLEGLPRNIGMHAAGVVISDQKLINNIPLQAGEELLLTQWAMGEVEQIGLLKMDFLSIRNLTIIENTLQSIKDLKSIDLNIKQIPLDDQKVYAAFSQGETTGIFQFESTGMRNLLKKIKPKNLNDLALVNALHRPGASLNPNELIARRFKQSPITYYDAKLEPILKETYGVMVYQEQVMQVAVIFAGYSLQQADQLRRAMSKKNKQVMQAEQEPFINSAMQQGHSREQAEYMFEQIAAFAGYGFNKSHAIAYSLLAYQMMYLKINYPLSFYMALLRTTVTQSQTFFEYITSLKKQGLHLLVPDINRSLYNFIVDKGNIRYGLNTIKGVDRSFVTQLIEERKKAPYKSLKDVIYRLEPNYRKEKYFIPLIEAGVFDSLETNRDYLKERLSGIISEANLGIGDLFEMKDEKREPENKLLKLAAEKERLGIYVSATPLDSYEKINKLLNLNKVSLLTDGEYFRGLVFVTTTKIRYTKDHRRMQKIEVNHYDYQFSITVFADSLTRYGAFEENKVYFVTGKFKVDKYGEQLIANYYLEAETLLQLLEGPKIYLRLPDNKKFSTKIKNFLLRNHYFDKDSLPVIIVNEQGQSFLLSEQYFQKNNPQIIAKLVAIVGEDNLKIK